MTTELEVAGLMWAIDDQPAGDLPNIASDALVRGLDSPALRELAGTVGDDFWQVKRLFERALRELGYELPDEQGALWRLARHKASEIVAGCVTPTEGAHWIWSHVCDRPQSGGDLRVFIGLASEWDDSPEHRTELDLHIVAAARWLFERAEPRRWLRLQARAGAAPVVDSGTRAPIALDELPIAKELGSSLGAWGEEYDTLMGLCPPGFEDESAAKGFVDRGRVLAERLQADLGESWHIEYYPEPTKPPGLKLQAEAR